MLDETELKTKEGGDFPSKRMTMNQSKEKLIFKFMKSG
jgi:hypothetical protein